MTDIEDWKLDVGPGWHIILDYTDNALNQWIPGYQIVQIKEKFGRLRYYFNLPNDFEDSYDFEDENSTKEHNERLRIIHNFVHAMELLSGTICEECGKPGQTHTNKRGWSLTVCEEHKEKD